MSLMLHGGMVLKSHTLNECGVVVRELGSGVAAIAYEACPELEQDGKTMSEVYFFTTTYVEGE